jgi:RimJ/RimL family protein N-acetyltransferase
MAVVEPRQLMFAGSRHLLRSLEPADALAALAHARACATESNFLLTTAEEFDLSEDQERAWIEGLRVHPNQLGLGAFRDGELVGVLAFESGRRRRNAHRGEFGMSVRKSYWGNGIATALIQALLDWAHGRSEVELVCLSVFASNERAIRLYRRFGFSEDGRRRRSYRLGADSYEDEVLMSLFV